MLYTLAISILSVFYNSGEPVTKLTLEGSWQLKQISLHTDGKLQGTMKIEDTSTIFEFRNISNYTELTIYEDGNIETHCCIFDEKARKIVIHDQKSLEIERMTENELILSHKYAPHNSTYCLVRIEN